MIHRGNGAINCSRTRRTAGCTLASKAAPASDRANFKTLEWGPKDVFVVPSWHRLEHESDEETVTFSFSDRLVQKQ